MFLSVLNKQLQKQPIIWQPVGCNYPGRQHNIRTHFRARVGSNKVKGGLARENKTTFRREYILRRKIYETSLLSLLYIIIIRRDMYSSLYE